jgi:hypothetical protein
MKAKETKAVQLFDTVPSTGAAATYDDDDDTDADDAPAPDDNIDTDNDVITVVNVARVNAT